MPGGEVTTPGSHSKARGERTLRSVDSRVPDCNHHAIQPPFPEGLEHLGAGWIRKENVYDIHVFLSPELESGLQI